MGSCYSQLLKGSFLGVVSCTSQRKEAWERSHTVTSDAIRDHQCFYLNPVFSLIALWCTEHVLSAEEQTIMTLKETTDRSARPLFSHLFMIFSFFFFLIGNSCVPKHRHFGLSCFLLFSVCSQKVILHCICTWLAIPAFLVAFNYQFLMH